MERSRPALIALIALSAAGCFSDRGIAIEVDVGTTGATSVELYVGNSACVDHKDAAIPCGGGIAPPMFSAHLAGTVWFRDDEVPYRARVVDRKATFRLQADADTTLPIVIAVGSGGDPASPVGTATLTDVNVPAKTARILTTKLVAAGPVQPSTNAATEDRVEVWPQPAGSSCVVVEHWTDGKATRDFIVPAKDPDCDSVASECDPAAANAVFTSDGIDKAPACFATSNETAAHACRLGALSCSDATGPEDPSASCLTTREEVCVPEAFCECRGKQLDTACTKPKLEGNTDRIPRFVCTIQLLDGGKACSDASEVYDFSDRLDNGGCKFALSALDLMSLASGDRSHVFNGLDLELANNGCGFKIQVNPDATHMTTIPELGMVRMGASDGPAVLVPIILQFQRIPLVRECPTKPLVPLCAFIEVPDDPMWSCLP